MYKGNEKLDDGSSKFYALREYLRRYTRKASQFNNYRFTDVSNYPFLSFEMQRRRIIRSYEVLSFDYNTSTDSARITGNKTKLDDEDKEAATQVFQTLRQGIFSKFFMPDLKKLEDILN